MFKVIAGFITAGSFSLVVIGILAIVICTFFHTISDDKSKIKKDFENYAGMAVLTTLAALVLGIIGLIWTFTLWVLF